MSVMKIPFALALGSAASAAFATSPVMPPLPQTEPIITCRELTAPGKRVLQIHGAKTGFAAYLSGRQAPIAGIYDQRTSSYRFRSGNEGDASFVQLEIKVVNQRPIGILLEPTPTGAGLYKKTIFQCAGHTPGSASSNGR